MTNPSPVRQRSKPQKHLQPSRQEVHEMSIEELNRLKAEKGWTNADIARMLGISERAVEEWRAEGRRSAKPRRIPAPAALALHFLVGDPRALALLPKNIRVRKAEQSLSADEVLRAAETAAAAHNISARKVRELLCEVFGLE